MFSNITSRVFCCYLFIITAFFFSLRLAHAAPSFSCDKASALEKVICSDATLSQKDQQLADFYSIAYHHAFGNETSGLIASQRQWIINRNKDCAKNPTVKCINGYYDWRLFDLAVNNLFNDHDRALAEIARQSPKLKNVYQAIYDYATINNSHKRVRVVAANLGDAFDMLNGRDGIENFPDVAAVTRSAENMGALIWLVSVWDYGETQWPLVIPCDTFIKRPETIVWLEPRGGGAMDGQSPLSNCAQVMPALKHVSGLADKADAKVVADGGTIRFSIGAQGAADFSAILTHSLDVLHRSDPFHPTKLSSDMTVFLKDNAPEVALALAEVSLYYQNYFHVPAESAKVQAQQDLTQLLSDYLDGGS